MKKKIRENNQAKNFVKSKYLYENFDLPRHSLEVRDYWNCDLLVAPKYFWMDAIHLLKHRGLLQHFRFRFLSKNHGLEHFRFRFRFPSKHRGLKMRGKFVKLNYIHTAVHGVSIYSNEINFTIFFSVKKYITIMIFLHNY